MPNFGRVWVSGARWKTKEIFREEMREVRCRFLSVSHERSHLLAQEKRFREAKDRVEKQMQLEQAAAQIQPTATSVPSVLQSDEMKRKKEELMRRLKAAKVGV